MISTNLIDIEASGLGIDSYPIEVAILVNGEMHSWLINPEPSWQHWDKTAEAMHGISRELLLMRGLQARNVADAINDVMSSTNGLLYSDAAEWDDDWVKTLFHAVGAVSEFHILPISDLFNDAEFQLFKCKREELAKSGKYRCHRAEPDVRMINEALSYALGK